MSDSNKIFKKFVKEMNEILHTDLNRNFEHKDLLNNLFKYEERFRKILISTKEGKEIYKKFIDFIMVDKGNILSARSYFRERYSTFSKKMSKAFSSKKPYLLYKYRINFMFIKWAMDRYEGPKKRYLIDNFEKIKTTRNILCENNLPLAINRAKVFWSKFPESPVDYMDMVQDSAEGLLIAIDKFSPPYKEVFKSVAVGRMMLNMSNDHNDTFIKISSVDRRILYRANTARKFTQDISEDQVLAYVRQKFKSVSAAKLQQITSAATGMVSLDVNLNSDTTNEINTNTTTTTYNDIVNDGNNQTPDEIILQKKTFEEIKQTFKDLDPLQIKILQLKTGVQFKK